MNADTRGLGSARPQLTGRYRKNFGFIVVLLGLTFSAAAARNADALAVCLKEV